MSQPTQPTQPTQPAQKPLTPEAFASLVKRYAQLGESIPERLYPFLPSYRDFHRYTTQKNTRPNPLHDSALLLLAEVAFCRFCALEIERAEFLQVCENDSFFADYRDYLLEKQDDASRLEILSLRADAVLERHKISLAKTNKKGWVSAKAHLDRSPFSTSAYRPDMTAFDVVNADILLRGEYVRLRRIFERTADYLRPRIVALRERRRALRYASKRTDLLATLAARADRLLLESLRDSAEATLF